VKVLVVCSGNTPGGEEFNLKIHQAFIYEQEQSLKSFGVEVEYFLIKGKGIFGYLKHYSKLKKELSKNYELIHAHNGLCGLISNLQRKIPVITTYHGSDINVLHLRLISYFAILWSSRNIFVSKKQYYKSLIKRNIDIIPCGVDLTVFKMMDKTISKRTLNLPDKNKYVLFSSAFSIKIKNKPLVNSALKYLVDEDIKLLELKDKTREEVSLLINSSELLILTSFSEGSPQIIKESMACNCPIVSTDVGDVRQIFGETEGCYICSYDPEDVADKIKMALSYSHDKGRTTGRNRIIELGLGSDKIANRIISIYQNVLKESKI
jgi:teichuronic acid biosynthesis glycosyltransferase TuaC